MKISKLRKVPPLFMAVATTILLSTSSVFAQTNADITGNGAGSVNMVTQNTSNTNTVYQDNTATVSNKLKITSSTGGNLMNGLTGGNALVETGNTNVSAKINNTVNTNQAILDSCNCAQTVDALIEGNGAGSTNIAEHNRNNTASIVQEGKATVTNQLDIQADTGTNQVTGLTGGEVQVKTGNVTIAPVDIINTINTNIAVVGANGGADTSPHMMLTVGGNGADSVNIITANTNHLVGFFQSGDSTILNDLQIDGNTGNNLVADNTMYLDPSAAVIVETGDVLMDVYVDTASGFNIASDDCGCIQDVQAAIEGNGTEAYSDVLLNMTTDSLATQDNIDEFNTEGEMGCNTGVNDSSDNTNGGATTHTGNCDTNFQDINTGSSNFFGRIAELPAVSSVNMTAFLSALGVSIEAL